MVRGVKNGMADTFQFVARDRGILSVSGDDRRPFLQGLISNDVEKATPERAIHAAFLTAQGKYLHDFFLIDFEGRLLIDCEAERRADLQQRLRRYRLRSRVELADETEAWMVAVVAGDEAASRLGLPAEPGSAQPFEGGAAFVDPRLPELGVRLVLPRESGEATLGGLGIRQGEPGEYDRLRLGLGVPDGSRDLPVEKAFLLESGFDELNGIDWDKGCYIGQELTARTKYRGLVRRRLMPVAIEGPAPEPGTPLYLGEKNVGEMRSARGDVGLAMIRLEALAEDGDVVLAAGEARVRPQRPEWASF